MTPVALPSASRPLARSTPALRSARVATWLVWAVVAELLLLRMGTRTAVHIPGLNAIAGPLTVVSTAARIAFSAAVVLAIALLLAQCVDLWMAGHRARPAAAAVGVFVCAAVAAVLGAPVLVLDMATLAAVVVVAPFAVGERARWSATWWWAAILVILGGAIPAITEAAATTGLGTLRLAWLAGPIEILAVLVAIASPLLTGRASSRRAGFVAVTTALVVGAAFAFGSSTTEILVLWNFGLSGFLPAAVYGLAAGCVAHTLVRLTETGRATEAAAVFLVLAGGVGLQSTYQSALTLGGLCLAGLAVTALSAGTVAGVETAPALESPVDADSEVTPPT